MPLLPESDNKYFLTVADAEITFVRDHAGQATSLTFRQNGRDMVAQRVG